MIMKPLESINIKIKKELLNEKLINHLINFHLNDSKESFVFYDLKLEHKGLLVQIECLILTRKTIYVILSKFFSGKLRILNGNWSVRYKDKEINIPSPILQNEKYIRVLKGVLEELNPGGLKKIPEINNIVLISSNSFIVGKTPKNVFFNNQFKLIEEEVGFFESFFVWSLKETEEIAYKLLELNNQIKEKEC